MKKQSPKQVANRCRKNAKTRQELNITAYQARTLSNGENAILATAGFRKSEQRGRPAILYIAKAA